MMSRLREDKNSFSVHLCNFVGGVFVREVICWEIFGDPLLLQSQNKI